MLLGGLRQVSGVSKSFECNNNIMFGYKLNTFSVCATLGVTFFSQPNFIMQKVVSS